MSFNNVMRNYKHDITGKFRDITTAVSVLDEASLNQIENNEVFHAIHEVLLKMVRTSRNTIMNNLQQEVQLHVLKNGPDVGLPKLQIEGVTVRYKLSPQKIEYVLYLLENEGNPAFLLGKLHGVLPIKEEEMKRVLGTIV